MADRLTRTPEAPGWRTPIVIVAGKSLHVFMYEFLEVVYCHVWRAQRLRAWRRVPVLVLQLHRRRALGEATEITRLFVETQLMLVYQGVRDRPQAGAAARAKARNVWPRRRTCAGRQFGVRCAELRGNRGCATPAAQGRERGRRLKPRPKRVASAQVRASTTSESLELNVHTSRAATQAGPQPWRPAQQPRSSLSCGPTRTPLNSRRPLPE